MNKVIIDYIKEASKNGISKEQIKQNLETVGGVSESEIEEAFKIAGLAPEAIPSPPIPPPIYKEEKTVIPPENIAATPVQPITPKGRNSKKIWVGVITALIIVLLGSSLVYAYLYKIGPFSIKQYSEDNFFSNLLEKISQINSSSYTFSGALEIVPRDKDAEPFAIKQTSNAAELSQQYYYDSVRAKNASAIISRLNSLSNYSSYSSYQSAAVKPYPNSIKLLFKGAGSSSYSSSNSVTDPETSLDYEYQATDGGKNFLLTISFETDYAIKAIKGYRYSATSTVMNGKKVSFTKDSYPYIYMSSEPPKPFFVSLSESLAMFPADISVKSSISASSEMKEGEMADWLFNFDAEGDFSDLTYKINVDARKKDDNYYFKINNFPSIFLLGEIGLVKGKWVSISSKASSSSSDNSYSSTSFLREEIPNLEKNYKENRDKAIKFFKKLVAVADEEKLIVFRTKPQPEKVDNRQLIRYELGIKKESILPFYNKLQEEINNDPDFSEFRNMIDQGLVDYLKSDEFDQVFAYFDKNNTIVFWTDANGFPAIVKNSMRIVPSDAATQLKDKQISVVFKLIISDINKSLNIEAPSDSVPIEKIISDYEKSTEPSRFKSRDARRQSDLRQLISAQEMYYGDGGKYVFTAAKKGLPVIANYLSELNDPQCPGGVCESGAVNYSWQNNNFSLRCQNTKLNQSVSQWFCAYGRMEDKGSCAKVAYFAASHQGSKTVCDAEPTITGSCTCF